MAKVETVHVGLKVAKGTYEKIERIIEKDQTYLSVQEYIRAQIKKGIDEWEREHA